MKQTVSRIPKIVISADLNEISEKENFSAVTAAPSATAIAAATAAAAQTACFYEMTFLPKTFCFLTSSSQGLWTLISLRRRKTRVASKSNFLFVHRTCDPN